MKCFKGIIKKFIAKRKPSQCPPCTRWLFQTTLWIMVISDNVTDHGFNHWRCFDDFQRNFGIFMFVCMYACIKAEVLMIWPVCSLNCQNDDVFGWKAWEMKSLIKFSIPAVLAWPSLLIGNRMMVSISMAHLLNTSFPWNTCWPC